MKLDLQTQVELDTPIEAAGKSFSASFLAFLPILSGSGLVWDKVVEKIPFKSNAWERVKQDLPLDIACAAAFAAWGAYRGYKKAEKQQADTDKLTVKNAIYNNQLEMGSIKPHETTSVSKVDTTRTLKFAPTAALHTEKIAADKAKTAANVENSIS